MSNIIDKIQLSGVTYDLPSGGGGNTTVELTQAEYDALVSGGTVDPDTYYIITDATPQDMSQYWTSAQTNSAITQAVSGKQDTLVSGTNIKTINNESILGSGNIDIQGGGGITSGEVQTMIDESISGKADTSYVQASRLKSMSGGSLDYSAHPSYIKDIDVKGNILKATLSYQDNGDYWEIYDKDVLRFGDGLLYKYGALSTDERIIDSYSTENSYCYELSAVTTESYVNLSLGEFIGVKFDGVQNFFMADFTLYGDSAQTNERISISYRRNDGYMEGDLNIAVFNANGKLVYTKTSTVYSQATNNIIIPFEFEGLGFTTPSWLYVDSMVKDSITSICGVDRIEYTSVKEFVKELDSEIDTKVATSAVTTAVTSGSTDSEIPSAKAVYDALQEGGGGGGGMTEDDELLLSTALTDLNDRKADKSLLGDYQRKGDYVTTSTLNTRLADYETALDEQNVEEVTAYALNDLNNRVTDNTTALGGMKLVKITESEYAALTTKDENTLYIVVADPS